MKKWCHGRRLFAIFTSGFTVLQIFDQPEIQCTKWLRIRPDIATACGGQAISEKRHTWYNCHWSLVNKNSCFSVFVWRMLIAENIMSCWHLCKLCNRIHMNKLASFQPWTYTEMNPNANEVPVACMHPINHISKFWDGGAKPLGQAVLHQTPFPGGQAWNWLFLPQGNYGGLGCRVQSFALINLTLNPFHPDDPRFGKLPLLVVSGKPMARIKWKVKSNYCCSRPWPTGIHLWVIPRTSDFFGLSTVSCWWASTKTDATPSTVWSQTTTWGMQIWFHGVTQNQRMSKIYFPRNSIWIGCQGIIGQPISGGNHQRTHVEKVEVSCSQKQPPAARLRRPRKAVVKAKQNTNRAMQIPSRYACCIRVQVQDWHLIVNMLHCWRQQRHKGPQNTGVPRNCWRSSFYKSSTAGTALCHHCPSVRPS